jgi:ribosome-associated toxin RatA of RatAB toxin-antitoxin module
MMLWLSLALAQTPSTLEGMLQKGEVNLLETWGDGTLRSVTTVSFLPVEPAKVWALLVDFESYESWMPQVAAATVVSSTEAQGKTTILVDWKIAVVGPDVGFRGSYEVDAKAGTIKGTWVSGALAGSSWDWKVEGVSGGTRLYRTIRVNVVDSNWVLKQVEDENHTLDYGINSSVGVIEVRGVKKALGVGG